MPLDPKAAKRIGKLIALVLRHQPKVLDLELDAAGWTDATALLDGLRRSHDITMADREALVAGDEKGRYSLRDGRIRANQGHSVPVDLGLEPVSPPEVLYHGTVERFLASILAEGLRPGSRSHVHLSPDIPTATTVGSRRGRPIILAIDAGCLSRAGHPFYVSSNGVWLTDHVPPAAVRQLPEETRT